MLLKWAETQTRSPLSITNSSQQLLTRQDNSILCHRRDSLKQWNIQSSTIKLFQIKTPQTQHSMSSTLPQIFGLLSWITLLQNNQQEWRQWRTRQRMRKKFSRLWRCNTIRQDRPELPWSWSKLSQVLQLCEIVSTVHYPYVFQYILTQSI